MGTENNNRVEAEVMNWRQKEDRFQKIFSFDMSSNKGLRREQLREYDRIAVKYRNTKDPDERLTLMALKQERRHIEKKAYTNRFVRIFRKIFINPIRRFRMAQENKKMEQSNRENISRQLRRMGMGEHTQKVEKRMKNGEKEFTVPVSYQVNANERMDHNLVIKQNSAGEYKMESNNVRLKNETDPKMNRQQTFKFNNGMTTNTEENYNLMHGRAVHKNGKWVKLDLNDKDTEGNYRVKEFNQSYGYDVEKSLKELPIKEMNNKQEREKLIADLKNGKQSQVTIGNKKYNVEANPQFKTVNIYDENSQKMSKAEVQGKKSMKEHLAQDDFKTKVAKKNGIKFA